MDKLSKAQKDEYATAFAILALYDGGVSVTQQPVCLVGVCSKHVTLRCGASCQGQGRRLGMDRGS